jgi:hypothetical protein
VFVGGSVFGNVETTMDDETQAALLGIARTAPQIMVLLRKALDDGLISPEIARDLAITARNIDRETAHLIWEGGRNINADTAHWIFEGGRNINEDVAGWLAEAGRNINEDVAVQLRDTAQQLAETVGEFHDALRTLSAASDGLRSAKANAAEWRATAAAMEKAATALAMARQVRAQAENRFSWDSFRKGMIGGFGAAVVLALVVLVIVMELR